MLQKAKGGRAAERPSQEDGEPSARGSGSAMDFKDFLPSQAEMAAMRDRLGSDEMRARAGSSSIREREEDEEDSERSGEDCLVDKLVAASVGAGGGSESGGSGIVAFQLPPVTPKGGMGGDAPTGGWSRGLSITLVHPLGSSGRSLLRRSSSSGEHLVMRAKAKAPVLIKDWDNVVEMEGLEYHRKKRTSFFIEWEQEKGSHH